MARETAVVAPSTNTIVQPDDDSMRPPGVANHFSRIAIPDTAETFWDGSDGAERRHQRMLEHTHGVPVILGSTAPRAAFGDDAGSTRHSI